MVSYAIARAEGMVADIGGLHNRKKYIKKKFRHDFSIFFAFGGIFRYQNINIRIESFDFFEEFSKNDQFFAVS